jgi:hypothetical protein
MLIFVEGASCYVAVGIERRELRGEAATAVLQYPQILFMV